MEVKDHFSTGLIDAPVTCIGAFNILLPREHILEEPDLASAPV